jgi:hypothetical protein
LIAERDEHALYEKLKLLTGYEKLVRQTGPNLKGLSMSASNTRHGERVRLCGSARLREECERRRRMRQTKSVGGQPIVLQEEASQFGHLSKHAEEQEVEIVIGNSKRMNSSSLIEVLISGLLLATKQNRAATYGVVYNTRLREKGSYIVEAALHKKVTDALGNS